jgi:hypothetical protein
MALSPNVKVFEDFAYLAMTETVDQKVNKFNEASSGAIRLVAAQSVGNIKQKASFAAIGNLIRRRDAFGSGALTPVPLTQRQENTVKVGAGTSPVKVEQQQMSYIAQDPQMQGMIFGEQLAPGIIKDQLNTAVRCVAAACNGNVNIQYDASASALTFDGLNKALAKFGDHSQNIVCWVMHSKVMHDLYSNALNSGAFLFNYGTVNVMRDPFGKLFVVTDSPALINGSGKYLSFGLTANAVIVEDNRDFHQTMIELPGNENITTTYQAEWTYNIGVKGYSWTASTGGASPTDTALGTAANWTKTSTFDKTTAGVMMISA